MDSNVEKYVLFVEYYLANLPVYTAMIDMIFSYF